MAPMQEVLNVLEVELSSKRLFICHSRSDEGVVATQPTYSIRGHRSSLPQDWVMSSFASIKEYGASILFGQNERGDGGIRIFDAQQSIAAKERFLNTIAQCYEDYRAATGAVRFDDWIQKIVLIGEVVGADDVFVLDASLLFAPHQVIRFLQRECEYLECRKPNRSSVVAGSVEEFILRICRDPFPFIRSTWVGNDLSRQWYPVGFVSQPTSDPADDSRKARSR